MQSLDSHPHLCYKPDSLLFLYPTTRADSGVMNFSSSVALSQASPPEKPGFRYKLTYQYSTVPIVRSSRDEAGVRPRRSVACEGAPQRCNSYVATNADKGQGRTRQHHVNMERKSVS